MEPTLKKRWTNHGGVQQLICQSRLGVLFLVRGECFRFQVNLRQLFCCNTFNLAPLRRKKCVARLPLIIAAYSETTIALLWADGGVFARLHLLDTEFSQHEQVGVSHS